MASHKWDRSSTERRSASVTQHINNNSGEDFGEDQDSLDIKPPQAKIMTTSTNYATTHQREVGIGIYRSRNEKSDNIRKHKNNNNSNSSINNSKHYKKSSVSDKSNSTTQNINNNMSSIGGGNSGNGSSRDRESERPERKRDWRYDDSNIRSSISSNRNISKLERTDAHMSSHRYPKYHEENPSDHEEEYHYHNVHSSHSYHNNSFHEHYEHQLQQLQPQQQRNSTVSGNYYKQQQQQNIQTQHQQQQQGQIKISNSSSSKNALNHYNSSSSRSVDDYAMNEAKMLELKAYANEKQQQQRKHRKLRFNEDKHKLADEQTEHDLRSRLLSKRHKFMKSTHEDNDDNDHDNDGNEPDLNEKEMMNIKIDQKQLKKNQLSPDEHNNILELQRERILLRNLLKGTYSNNESHEHEHDHDHEMQHDFIELNDKNRENDREKDKSKDKDKLKRLKRTELTARANNKIISRVVDVLSPAAVAASVTAGLKDLSTTGGTGAITTTTITAIETTSKTKIAIADISQHKLSHGKIISNNSNLIKNQNYEIEKSLSDIESDADADGDDDNSEKNCIINEKNSNNNSNNNNDNGNNSRSKIKKPKKKKKKKKKRREHQSEENKDHSDLDIVRLDDDDERDDHDDNNKSEFLLSDDSNEELEQKKQQKFKNKKHSKKLNEANNLKTEKTQTQSQSTGASITATAVSISSENSSLASSSSSSTQEDDDHDNNTNGSYTTPKTKHKHKKHHHQSRHNHHYQHQQSQRKLRQRKRHTTSITLSEKSRGSETAYKSESSCTSAATSRSHSASSICEHSATESATSDLELKIKKTMKIEKSSIMLEEKSAHIDKSIERCQTDLVVNIDHNMEKNVVDNKMAKCDNNNIIDADENLNLPNYFPGVQGCRSVEEFQCLNRIEEGTYGVVYRAKDKRTNEVVALKRLKMEKEKEGFPITSLREINTLLKGQHPNIVTVREIVVGSNMDKIFIVMDYVEHDLKSLMETMKQRKQNFLPSEVKCLIQQLLRAVAHLHDNWILHRDLKTSNLLLSHKGILKVGDFGLAREYGSPLKRYTLLVVTLWYRAPELLLCSPEYSTPIDMWSVGCIFAELLLMRPLFTGESEIDQLNRIFKELGTPNEDIWPGFQQLPAVKNLISQNSKFTEFKASNLKKRFGESVSDMGIQLLQGMLTYDPSKRLTAEGALRHSYFTELPLPIDPSMFPTWPAKSELGARKSAASPKPPSGGRHFKRQEEANLSHNQNKSTNSGATMSNSKILSGIISGNKKSASSTGFVLNAGIEQRQYTSRSGFNSKF